MSIFGTIMSAIFGRAQPSQASAAQSSAGPLAGSSGPAAQPAAAQTSAASGGAAPGGQAVDVEAVLNRLASEKKQKLDWRHSIVDLMKLLDLDSSLAARKQLAQELHYTGDTNDSASMNIWLHKQVMKKLAENGGKVPAELRH